MEKIFHFVSSNILSGAENIVINICTLVRGEGSFKFVYVSPSGPINYYLKKYNIKHIIINKMTPYNVREVIKKYRPNIVHGHDVKASLCLAINSHLCHRHKIKIISELHNDDPRMWKFSIRALLYFVSSFFYDKIIVVSSPTINHYIFKNIIQNKTYIINNIVNNLRIKKYSPYPKKWDCMFLGRFVDQKNPLKFVKIVYILKNSVKDNILAIMIGNGPLMIRIKQEIKYYDLDNNVKLVGFKRDPYKYLFKSKVLIIPSRYEGFGLVALESLLCGVPVISSPVGGLKNIINSKCGCFDIKSVDFARDAYNIISNNNIYKGKSFNAKKHGNKINNVKSFIYKYVSLYYKLLKEH